jgi:hypothetical protein
MPTSTKTKRTGLLLTDPGAGLDHYVYTPGIQTAILHDHLRLAGKELFDFMEWLGDAWLESRPDQCASTGLSSDTQRSQLSYS